ncbi:MAG: hypothetical protein HC900_01830 [Methylacidiphilales bacterium]|nr:hypothetical protein [Candidatus Methylacidiphilales bacterium]
MSKGVTPRANNGPSQVSAPPTAAAAKRHRAATRQAGVLQNEKRHRDAREDNVRPGQHAETKQRAADQRREHARARPETDKGRGGERRRQDVLAEIEAVLDRAGNEQNGERGNERRGAGPTPRQDECRDQEKRLPAPDQEFQRRLAIDAEPLHQPGNSEHGPKLRQGEEFDMEGLDVIEPRQIALGEVDAKPENGPAEPLHRNRMEYWIKKPRPKHGQGNIQ